jgi:small subunit ribosomal protein S6
VLWKTMLWQHRHGDTLHRFISCSGPLPSQFRGRTQPKGGDYMKAYELLLLLNPSLDEEARQAVLDKIQGIITADGGVVDTLDGWGKRKLAFEIGKVTEGDYVLFDFHTAPAAIAEIDRVLRITDAVVRFMLVQREDRE